MRRVARLSVLALMTMSMLPVAPSAHAMVCPIETGSQLEPNPDAIACSVFSTVLGPACSRFNCE